MTFTTGFPACARNLLRPAFALLVACWAAGAAAQKSTDQELQALLDSARRHQTTPVLLGLRVDGLFSDVPATREAAKKQIAESERMLALVLGPDNRNWSNGLGQVGFELSPAGITDALNLPYVVRVMPDIPRGTLFDPDHHFPKILDSIARTGRATVAVVPRYDNLQWQLGRDGQAVFPHSALLAEEVRAKAAALVDAIPARGVLNLDAAKQSLAQGLARDARGGANPVITLSVNRRGFLHLQASDRVRSLRMAGLDARPEAPDLSGAPKIMAEALRTGSARVVIGLRTPDGFSPNQAEMSKASWEAQSRSMRDALREIVSELDAASLPTISDVPTGGGFVTLPYGALGRLLERPDPRIKFVQLNEALAISALPISTSNGPGGLNVQTVWNNNNFRGQGQFIAILDTGTERGHPFFFGKAIGEACFGTNSVDFFSLCPGQDAVGDSAAGALYSGAPCGAPIFPPPAFSPLSDCQHGTMVAGIAAGMNGPGGMNGVAPAANLFIVNVNSRHRTWTRPGGQPYHAILIEDLVAALQTLLSLQPAFPQQTVNMSFSGGAYQGNCDNVGGVVNGLVNALKAVRIPVVAATGNDGIHNAIGWPACLSNVIKAAASDKNTGAFWPVSNAAPATSFTGPIFLAPGTNVVTSDTAGRWSMPVSGTSFAAPHVAGMYALLKSTNNALSVDDLNAFFLGSASVPTFVAASAPGMPYLLPRLRLPYW